MRLKKTLIFPLLLILSLTTTAAYADDLTRQQPVFENKLMPFATDGCSSIAPDGTPRDRTKWQTCCVEHDVSYWMGGTWDERKDADLELKQCIAEKSESKIIGQLYYLGVRMGGTPAYKTSYRWGYGWSYDRGYAPLGPDENEQVDELLKLLPRSIRDIPIADKPKSNLQIYPMRTQSYCQDEAEALLEKKFGPYEAERVDYFTKRGEKFIKFRINSCKGSIRFGFGEDLYQCTMIHYKNTPPKLIKEITYFGDCKPDADN